MTMTAAALTETQQVLIDARLDSIDRVLLGRVPREDRLAIVREVESQIQELLGQYHSEEITRETVINILRRLDPPEAYLAEEGDDADFMSRIETGHRNGSAKLPRQISVSNEGRLGGVLGLISFVWIPLAFWFMFLLDGQAATAPLVITLSLIPKIGFACSVLAVVFSIRGRDQGIWPIVGLILGAMSFLFWSFGHQVITNAL